MGILKSIGIPAAMAYLGVRGAELFKQKGALGAVLGIAGAGAGLYLATRVVKPAVTAATK